MSVFLLLMNLITRQVVCFDWPVFDLLNNDKFLFKDFY